MSSKPAFGTPSNIQDFQDKASYDKWSAWISDQHDSAVRNVEAELPIKSQYFNPAKTQVTDVLNAHVSWGGFPKRMNEDFFPGTDEFYLAAEKPVTVKSSAFLQWYMRHEGYSDVLMRIQDEYLEWFSHYENGLLTQVDFTCEGPEYWKCLHDWEPNVLLALYQKFVSPKVRLEDLEWIEPGDDKKSYNPWNKWNSTHGIMHLNCPPNSLNAEIDLAGQASVLYGPNGVAITDPIPLARCAHWGQFSVWRNSDPNIAAAVSAQCLIGKMASCRDPVGLYIQSIETGSWLLDGEQLTEAQVEKILKIERGVAAVDPTKPGYILRLSVKNPDDASFKLSDLKINNRPLKYGGQIAETVQMSLSATFGHGPVGTQPVQPCRGTRDTQQEQPATQSVAAKSSTSPLVIRTR